MKKIFSMNRFEGWNLSLPLIQGGMGVGVSLSGLAGAVASEGGMGVISTAQIGFEEPDFVGNEEACNLRSIRKHIVRAKELASGKGMIAVNVMVALQQYREHVKEAVRAGADAVICGAGLPVDLPELVEAGKAKIAPIVSSRRAAALLLKTWDKKYGRTADFIVTEGPEAGGHLGFSREQLDDISKIRFEEELTGIMEEKKKYEEKYGKQIPVFAAGGIWDASDAKRIEALGADGVQAATRFVATKECDASSGYKKAHAGIRFSKIDMDDSKFDTSYDAMNVWQMPLGVTFSAAFEQVGWKLAPMVDLPVVPAFGDKDAVADIAGGVHDAVRVVDTNPIQATLGLTAETGAWTFGVHYGLTAGGDERLNNAFNATARYAF